MDKGGEGRHAPKRANIPATKSTNVEVFLRPNAPVTHGSVLYIIEHATKYFINMKKYANSVHQSYLAFWPSN
jgi:hypothetical protein